MNCIKQDEDISFCGSPLDSSFHFKSIDQVIINNVHGSRLVCPYCAQAVINALVRTPPGHVLTDDAQDSTV